MQDPVVLGIKTACFVAVIILVILAWGWVRPFVAVAFHDCPAGSHAVWDADHGGGRALCGDTFTGTGKSR